MVDLVDMAEELRAQQVQASINARQQFTSASEMYCEDYAAEIPAQRRAIGGVTCCIQCQTNFEAKQKHFR